MQSESVLGEVDAHISSLATQQTQSNNLLIPRLVNNIEGYGPLLVQAAISIKSWLASLIPSFSSIACAALQAVSPSNREI